MPMVVSPSMAISLELGHRAAQDVGQSVVVQDDGAAGALLGGF